MSANPPETPFDHGLRRQSVVRAVLTDIFHGRLRPGQRLVTEMLANRFGVSHTPIREALIELGGVGVVDLLPNRGAVVRRVTVQTVREVCQVRKVLECEAVRGAARRADPAEVAAVAADIRRLAGGPADPDAVARARDLDSRLHDLIRVSCGNAFLAAELERLLTLFRAFRDVTWDLRLARNDYHRVGVEAAEHLAITDALTARDPAAAARAMSAHMRSGVLYWSQVTASLTAQPDDRPDAPTTRP
ncbi:MAG: GntR family transcriptional regulator [Isosphaera sp.]|nr:GntR family transcriptional regulator [Isosphaera sp.]